MVKCIIKERKRNSSRQCDCQRRFLQIAKERREAKGKGEKERYTQLKAEFQRITRRDKKAILNK